MVAGGDNNVAVAMGPYTKPVFCGARLQFWEQCREIVFSMPADTSPQVFGPRDDPTVTRGLPIRISSGSFVRSFVFGNPLPLPPPHPSTFFYHPFPSSYVSLIYLTKTFPAPGGKKQSMRSAPPISSAPAARTGRPFTISGRASRPCSPCACARAIAVVSGGSVRVLFFE